MPWIFLTFKLDDYSNFHLNIWRRYEEIGHFLWLSGDLGYFYIEICQSVLGRARYICRVDASGGDVSGIVDPKPLASTVINSGN
jgi:hypothetical protein